VLSPRPSDEMANIKPTFAAVLDIDHFEVFKDVFKQVCVGYLVCLSCACVCKLSLTLDSFINDLYKQSIFWFNGCLNASFIIYYWACNYCL
jgi:hypothetical protein